LGVLGLLPDALIAYVVMKLTNGEWSTFVWVWLAIQAIYILYWVKTALWASIIWHVWRRHRAASEALEVLRLCEFPKPDTGENDAGGFLARVRDDEEQPVAVRLRAAEWAAAVHAASSHGMQASLQLGQAWRDALVAYRRGAGAYGS
jgi:hypothetical protein